MNTLRALAAILTLTLAPALHAADGSLSFSGTAGQFVQVPNFDGLGITGEVTVEFWAQPADAAERSIFVLDADIAANRFQAHLPWVNGSFMWDFGDITTTGRLVVAAPAGSVGSWRHYALVATQGGNAMRIYQNGVLIASKTGMDALTATSTFLRIGGSNSFPYSGKLDDFRIWNVARTEAEIRVGMASPPLGSEPNLRLYLRFDEGSGTTAVNSATATGSAFNGTLNGSPARVASPFTSRVVTTNADTGAGSLRQAIADAAAATTSPSLITFDSGLSGQTIALASEIIVSTPQFLVVDASSLPGGITLSGGNAKRLFSLSPGSIVTLRGLTLTGGNGTGSFDSGRGGAIYANNATLVLDRCTLSNNIVPGDGGAIFANFGIISLTNCTLASNSAGSRGGAIFNKGTLTLTHCTVAGNSASSEGGGIYNDFVGCTLNNSIVATNTATSGFGAQILQDGGTLTRVGANLVSSLAAGTDLFNGAVLAGSGTVSNAAPNLAALASNGGPTQTRLPNAGSPAINAAVGSTAATDQRGLTRPQGGTADIGAIEVASTPGLVVQNNADSGPGSLRQAIADAAAFPDTDTITFAPALSGQTITLAGVQFTLGNNVTIDATTLTSPVTLSGNSNGNNTLEAGESRIFDIPAGVTVVLRRLNLISGIANPSVGGVNGRGGAIRSSGQLTVDQCTISACRAYSGAGLAVTGGGSATLTQSTLSGNSASFGGGIDNSSGGTVTLTQSTLSGNSTLYGGGIHNSSGGTVTLTQSTLSGNSATYDGGGINNVDVGSTVILTQSTLSGNSAHNGGSGGGINNIGGGTATLTQSTLSGNSAPYGGGIRNAGTLTLTRCIVAGNTATNADDNIRGSSSGSNNLTSGDPLLAPLGNYGGPTQTMPPLPGSPAIDAGGSLPNPPPTDQRGAPRVADGDGIGGAIVDIGAVEFIPAIVTSTLDSGSGSLRAALAAPYTSTVLFAAPLSGSTITLNGAHLTLSRSVTIDASTLPGGITLSGNSDGDNVLETGESRIFDIPAGVTVVLRRLNLINGIADPAAGDPHNYGGAVRNSGQLTVDECTISACRASFGGGIFNQGGGTVTLTDSTLSGLFATIDGGGIYNFGGTLTLSQSTLSDNSATSGGGGIYNRGTLILSQSTLSGNSASNDGGGIYNQPGNTATLTQSTLSGNSATYDGGGIYNQGTLSLTDSTLSDNSASDDGGGIYNAVGTATLTQSTLSGNFASDDGGGIYNGVDTLTLTQSTLSDNSANDYGGGIYNVIGTLTLTRTIVAGNTARISANIQPPVSVSGNLTAGDPLLAPLGNYGGSTQTMPPLPGSPALDPVGGDTSSGLLTDQRGAPRVADGDGNGSASVDIGAVEATPAVTSLLDSGPGSLRAALADPFTTNVLFAPALSGGTIMLTGGQLTISRSMGIDASGLTGGMRIFSNGTSRIFDIATGVTVALKDLTLLGGNSGGSGGGTIYNRGNLTLTRCTISGSSASGGYGGAIFNTNATQSAVLALTACTLAGNSAYVGGAIFNDSTLTLMHCTLSGNSADFGGGIYHASGTLALTHSIVAGNTAPNTANISGTFTGSPNLTSGNPLLAPLGNYGGRTPTMALLPTSPARNAATGSPATSDQRGFPIVGTPDLGAYEAGTLSDFDAFAAETPGPALTLVGDADQDGRTDLLEYATQSDPHVSSNGEITPAFYDQNAAGAITQANVTFPTRVGATDLIYTLRRTLELGSAWSTVATWNATTGVLTPASGVTASRNSGTGAVSVTDTNVSGQAKGFYQLVVTAP